MRSRSVSRAESKSSFERKIAEKEEKEKKLKKRRRKN